MNSALQRARAAVADVSDAAEVAEPDDPAVRTAVQRYLSAFEAADVPALVRLLAEDSVLEMPPVPLWYRGSGDYGLFMHRVFAMRGTGWRARLLTANGQPALAAYAPAPDGELRPHSLQALTVTSGGQVARNTVFADPGVFETFGLPQRFSSDELRPAR
ncbi:nuclear transport factor 2 family protein [Streptomyces sp. NPDC002346]